MGSNSDSGWRRAARVALLLIAGLTASAAPRSPFSAPTPAAAAAVRAGQVDDPAGDPAADPDAEDEDDEEAFPVPVFEDDKGSPFDSTSADTLAPRTGARPDSASFLPVEAESAEPETLRYVPPGEKPVGAATGRTKPGDEPAPIVKKPKGGPFGLPPIAVILGLTVVHVFVVKLVTD